MACSGKGNPEPTFSWLKDFIPIEFTPVRFSVMPTGEKDTYMFST